MVCPLGVVTIIRLGSRGSIEHSIRYPAGKNVLNPDINKGCPLNKLDTRSMTPGVSILFYTLIFLKLLYVFFYAALRLTFKILHDI